MTTQRNQTGLFLFKLGAGAVLISMIAACNGDSRVHGTNDASASAAAPSLGTADEFAVLAGTTVTNEGPTVISGSLGLSPGTAITGFPPGSVIGGTIHAADAVAPGAGRHDDRL